MWAATCLTLMLNILSGCFPGGGSLDADSSDYNSQWLFEPFVCSSQLLCFCGAHSLFCIDFCKQSRWFPCLVSTARWFSNSPLNDSFNIDLHTGRLPPMHNQFKMSTDYKDVAQRTLGFLQKVFIFRTILRLKKYFSTISNYSSPWSLKTKREKNKRFYDFHYTSTMAQRVCNIAILQYLFKLFFFKQCIGKRNH